jgi:hypothetical protein
LFFSWTWIFFCFNFLRFFCVILCCRLWKTMLCFAWNRIKKKMRNFFLLLQISNLDKKVSTQQRKIYAWLIKVTFFNLTLFNNYYVMKLDWSTVKKCQRKKERKKTNIYLLETIRWPEWLDGFHFFGISHNLR